jgi:hypothetical protein
VFTPSVISFTFPHVVIIARGNLKVQYYGLWDGRVWICTMYTIDGKVPPMVREAQNREYLCGERGYASAWSNIYTQYSLIYGSRGCIESRDVVPGRRGTKTPCAGETSAWATWREIEDTRTSWSAPGRDNRYTEMLQCRVCSERYTSAIIHITNIISKAAP